MTLKLNDNAKRQTELAEILKFTLEAISESLHFAKLSSTISTRTDDKVLAIDVARVLVDEKLTIARRKLDNFISSLDAAEEYKNLSSALQSLDVAIKNL